LKFDIKNSAGDVVRTFYENASKGIHRANWDLRYQSPGSVNLKNDKFDPTKNAGSSFRALPGKYTVEMSMFHNGELKKLAGPVEFEAKVLNNTTLPAKDRKAVDEFYTKVIDLWRVTSGTQDYFNNLEKKTAYIQQAIQQSPKANVELVNKANDISQQLKDIEFLFDGTPAKASWEEVPPEKMPLSNRFENIAYVSWQSTSEPTKTQKQNYDILMEEFPPVLDKLKEIDASLMTLETELDKMNAPYTPGRVPKF